jgi:hypothetical protein
MHDIAAFHNKLDDPRAKKYQMTASHITTLIEQATPRQVSDETIIILIGKDNTIESFVNERKFLSGVSASGNLTRQILSQLLTWETSFGVSTTSDFDITNYFPFVDLWPWLGCTYLEQAMGFLHDYILTVKPWIIVSFGQTVSSIATSSFIHADGMGRYLCELSSCSPH